MRFAESQHVKYDSNGKPIRDLIRKPPPPGFNFPHLVKRAFQRELITGKRPTREEIENEEVAWSNDLDKMWLYYHFVKDIKEFEAETSMLTGGQ